MQFESAFEIEKKSPGGRTTGEASETIYVSLNKAGRNHIEQISLRIGETVMHQMRWLAGDRVRITCGKIGDKKAVMIRRCQDGLMLSPSAGKKMKGKTARTYVKFRADDQIKKHLDSFVQKEFTPEIKEDCLVFTEQ